MRRRYVAYIRAAHKSDESVELQKKYIEEFAKTKKLEIDYYYIDNGYSGMNLDRPGLRQLLRDIKSRKVTNTVVFKDMSRLGRGHDVISNIVRETSKRNVELLSTMPEDTLYFSILSSAFRYEREQELRRKMMATEYYKRKELEHEKSS